MAYGVLYEFAFESTNHADCLIQILKKNYTGEVIKRKLGRPPILKRENKDRIYGTSCEIYAECVVDGEFSQLYTSSPYEFRVEVYRNNQLLWVGFVSPELYSEPDIAPPYDVQIIATDGLGELKDYTWNPLGLTTVQGILIELLGKSGLERSYYMASDLRYRNEYGSVSSPNEFLDIMLNLDHEEGETYYDVLQNLLSAFNFNISTYKDKWILFRETDFISDSADGRINIIDVNGYVVETEPGEFGSMKSCEYWPVGQLSVNIEPAKSAVELESPDHYKPNVLDFNSWSLKNKASYSEEENAYVLQVEGDMIDTGIYPEISQTINFDKNVAFLLGLKIKARKFGYVHSQDGIGVRVQMLGTVDGLTSTYWLKKPDISSGSPSTDYVWSLNYSDFEESIKGTQGGYATSADVQDIDIVIPLHDDGDNIHAKTSQLIISIFNSSLYDSIYVYDVSLVKYEQIEGYKANVKINNNAREENSDVNLSLTSGDRVPNYGEFFMTGIPIQPSGNGVIKLWNTHEGDKDYLSFMAQDWGQSIGLPKMRYSGVLNVPGHRYDLPVLFSRDNTYYFPKTYSFDLYNDELNVELISISAADVSLESVEISQIAQPSGQTGGNTTGGGTTGGGYVPVPLDKEMSDTSNNAVENRVIKAYVDGTFATKTSLSAIDGRVSVLESYFATSEDAGTQIDKWNEIVDFLNATEGTTLAGILATYATKDALAAVADSKITISGLTVGLNGEITQEALRTGLGLDTILSWYDTIGKFFKKNADGDLYVDGDFFTNGQFAAKIVGTENGGGGFAYLSDLYDVSLASLASGDLLTWNGSEWVNVRQSSLKPDLSSYATKTFVTSQGYITASALEPYAKKTDIPSLDGYATEKFVTDKGYITSSALAPYAKTADVLDKTSAQDVSGRKTFNIGPDFVSSGDTDAVHIGTDTRFNVYGTDSTIFGMLSSVFTLGSSSYNIQIRGKQTRPSYNGKDLALKSDVANLTESDIAAMGFTKNEGTYSKPSGGIPKSDLDGSVQTSLGKADSALQSDALNAYAKTADVNNTLKSYVTTDALNQFKGTTNITTLGTITSGVWNGSKIDNAYLANSKVTISGVDVSLGGAITQAALRTGLGLDDLIAWYNKVGVAFGKNADGTYFVDGDFLTNGQFAAAKAGTAGSGGGVMLLTSWPTTSGDYSGYALGGNLGVELNTRVRTLEGKGITWGEVKDKPNFATVATSGSYNDLTNKPTIPSEVTESTVSGWGFTKNTGTYSKPSGGIPKSDLASAVQTSLGKADTALQSYTEQYTGTITDIKMNGVSKGTSGVVDLGNVITAHQDISEKVNRGELAPVAFSGEYAELNGIPSSLPASDVYAWAKAANKPSYSWIEITGTPTIPDAYTKDESNSNFFGWQRGALDANKLYDGGLYMVASGSNLPFGSAYAEILSLPYRKLTGNSKPDFGAQIALPNGDDSTKPNSMFFRTSLAGTWNPWQEVLTTSNLSADLINSALGYTPYNESNPSGFITSSALADYLPLNGGTMKAGKAIRWESQSGKTPYMGQYATDGSFLIAIEGTSTNNGLVLGGTSGNLLWKGNRVLDAGNYASYVQTAGDGRYLKIADIGTQSVNYAASAGSVAWSGVTNRPTALSQFTDDVVSGKYLPLSGGEIRGNLQIINSNGEVNLYNTNKQNSGWFLYNGGSEWKVTDNGWYHDYVLIHSGNIGSQSVNYATSANYANSAGSASTFGGKSPSYYVGQHYEDACDINTIQENHITHAWNWTNSPVTGIASVLDLTYSPDWRAQLFFSSEMQTFYSRFRHSGTTWTNWREVAFADGRIAAADYAASAGVLSISQLVNINALDQNAWYDWGNQLGDGFADYYYGILLRSPDANIYTRVAGGNNDSYLRLRHFNYGTDSGWKIIAFKDDNVASAQSLVHSNGLVGATVASSGNILIGTTDDNGAKLQVNGNIDIGYGKLRFAGNSDSYFIGWGRDGLFEYKHWSGHCFVTTGEERLRINSNGNVLIGTTTDSGYKLDVAGTVRVTDTLYANNGINIGGIRVYAENGVLKVDGDLYTSGQFASSTAAN